MTSARATVCITAYNQSQYLAEAIESVLSQAPEQPEVFILDDASADDTPLVTSRYANRVTVIRSERNIGLVETWNKALTLGTAPYLAILHGDDLYAPSYLSRTADLLDAHRDAGFVYTAYNHIGPRGNLLSLVKPFPADHLWSGANEFQHHVRTNYVQCPTVLVRRDCYRRLGGFNPRFVYALDWEMWLRIESHGYEIGYIAEPLASWRFHPSSATRQLAQGGISLVDDEIAVMNHVFENMPEERRSLTRLRRFAFYQQTKRHIVEALIQARYGDTASARASLRDAATVYRAGSDPRFVPFLIQSGVRFASRRWLRRVFSAR
jgi:glycosyltransferase involved in cell wall biosynthesis